MEGCQLSLSQHTAASLNLPETPFTIRLLRGYLRQLGESVVEGSLIVWLILKLTGEIGDVGAHVEVPMAGQVEQNGFSLALPLAPQGLVDRRFDRMRGFRRRYNAFATGELHRGGKAFKLCIGTRLDQPQLLDVADHRRHTVVAQAAGVDRRGHESRGQGDRKV